MHWDSVGPSCPRVCAGILYLNTIREGGETFFPVLGKKIKPKRGRLVIFPSYFTHMHLGLPSLTKLMGRAIKMENKIDKLESRIRKVEDALDTILDVATTKKNIDIIKETKDEKKEANNEANGNKSKSSNSGKRLSKKSSKQS